VTLFVQDLAENRYPLFGIMQLTMLPANGAAARLV